MDIKLVMSIPITKHKTIDRFLELLKENVLICCFEHT